MKIKNSSGPQRCMLCLRSRNEAIREHLRTNTPCCPQCPLGDIIKDALRGDVKYVYSSSQDNQTDENAIRTILIEFVVWVIGGLVCYYLTYVVWDWNQVLAIIVSVFWPIPAIIALFYYIVKLIIGLF